ncbi:MAG: hypothetical protein GX297_00710 [Treponema sp.]|nr:hypothetical protein [Treponema sp.]
MNYSKQNIIVDLEFNAGVAVKEKNYFLTQTVGDLTLRVKDRLGLRGNNVIKPNISQDLYEISPRTSLVNSGPLYEKMVALPLMEKITAIYKKLTILREDGTVALTLDTLPDKIIKKTATRGYTAYYIEIFDYDYEGKPASQW